jgi:hypothetical protein
MIRGWLAIGARVAALAALAVAWLAPSSCAPNVAPRTVFLLDVSASMRPEAVTERWQQEITAARSATPALQATLAFAANASWLGGAGTLDLERARERIDPTGTDLAAAVDAALGQIVAGSPSVIGLLSDGWSTVGDAREALERARRAGIEVYWQNPDPEPVDPWIAAVDLPPSARVGQEVPITVELAGPLARTGAALDDFALEAGFANGVEPKVTTPLGPGGSSVRTLRLTPALAGRRPVELWLRRRSTGELLDARLPAALIEIEGPGSLLYAGHGDAPLLRSVRAAGWSVEETPAAELEGRATLAPYQAVVLDDVSVTEPEAPFWRALERAVRERGTGLLVLGGPRSFGAGAYRGSRLESLLPVTANRARPEDSAAVLFALDKSGSMESPMHGLDRLAYARRAVLDTVRALPDGDRAAVIAFDAEAKPLAAFAPAARVAAALDAQWSATPAGGTRLAPALREALREFTSEHAPRKLLVIVTDGFLGGESLDADIAALAQAHIEVLAIAIGGDAAVTGLEALLRPVHGAVLRVAEAAELPRLMRTAIAARRAPIAHGPFEVHAIQPLEFLPAPIGSWPTVDAYAITRPRAPELLRLESSAGDPILALQRVGNGRVAVLPAGLGAWSAHWVAWPEWPRFVGALLDSLRAQPNDPRLALRLVDRTGELGIEIDATDGANWIPCGGMILEVNSPDGPVLRPAVAALAPGRCQATVPAADEGIYHVSARIGEAATFLDHLRPGSLELRRRGSNPQMAEWLRLGLLRPWPSAGIASLRAPAGTSERPARRWVMAAFACFLLSIVIDCSGVFARRPRVTPARPQVSAH